MEVFVIDTVEDARKRNEENAEREQNDDRMEKIRSLESAMKADPVVVKNVRSLGLTPAEFSYESTVKALQRYHVAHGDLVMPRRFVVSENSTDYPSEWRGMDLSSTVYDMEWWQRHVCSHPDRVAELNELGFVWERLQPEWNLVMEALVTHSQLYGRDAPVPVAFVVPRGDGRWPVSTWGIKLGDCVHRIRSRFDFLRGHPDRVRQLENLGFVWDAGEHAFRVFLGALSRYAKLNDKGSGSVRRALSVPTTFVVPFDHPDWPEALGGYPLGVKCSAVRNKGVYVNKHSERRKALEELGFVFGPNSTIGWLETAHAAAIYSNLHGRTLNVPQNFIVPAPPQIMSQNDKADWPWPEYLWGLPLGQRLRDVRLKNRYLTGKSADSRRAQLNALGFDWNPKRGRRRTREDVEPTCT